MHRARSRSVSQLQDRDNINVDSHLNYINDFLKWTTKNLDRFIKLLEARFAAEDAYILALAKINKPSTVPDLEPASFFGEREPAFKTTMVQYEGSVSNVIKKHQDVKEAIRLQIEKLSKAKNKQEELRKNIKRNLGDANRTYTKHRMAVPKLLEDYSIRCGELRLAQQQFQQQQEHQQAHPPPAPAHEQDHHSEHTDISEDEVRPRTSSEFHHASPTLTNEEHRKTMSGFMAQVRSQFSNMAAGTSTVAMNVSDATKQFSKMKKFIEEADHKYREGVRELELSRRKQVHVSKKVIDLVDAAVRENSREVKTVLTDILKEERVALANQIEVVDECGRAADGIFEEADLGLFHHQCSTKGFMFPAPVQYENYYYPGKCKDMLFGMSLKDYYMDHRDRPVPLLVKKCIEAVECNGGLQKEGIYRISPTKSKVEIMKNAFERDEEAVDITKHDVFIFAAVLKNYLRDLKEPLFDMGVDTRREYHEISDKDLRLQFIRNLIWKMSLPSRETLHALICHLQRVNDESKTNKMGVQNLSVVFTPNIFQTFKSNVLNEWPVDNVFEDLVHHENIIFAEPPQNQSQSQSQQPLPNVPYTQPPQPQLFFQQYQTPPPPPYASANTRPNHQQRLPSHLSSAPSSARQSPLPQTPHSPQTPLPPHMPQQLSRDQLPGMLLTAGMAPPPVMAASSMEPPRGSDYESQQHIQQVQPSQVEQQQQQEKHLDQQQEQQQQEQQQQEQQQQEQQQQEQQQQEQQQQEQQQQIEHSQHSQQQEQQPDQQKQMEQDESASSSVQIAQGPSRLSRKPTMRAPPRQDSLSRQRQEKEQVDPVEPSHLTTRDSVITKDLTLSSSEPPTAAQTHDNE